ncbi:MAG: HD domain-containing phosphohydrolase, partial [Candidatus Acidiferrales bacterium]
QAVQMASKLRACIDGDPFLHAKNLTGSFGVASFPMHGSTPQELIQVADSSMYMSKHQGGNAVSTADHVDPREAQKWKRDVLEAYLGVTLKRLFSTGPEAFDEIYRRLEQFTQSLEQNPEMADVALASSENGTLSQLSPAIIETITSLAFAIDAKDHYTQGHSQKVASYAVLLAEALAGEGRLSQAEVEEIRLAALLHDVGKVGIPEAILNKTGPLNGEEWEIMKTHTSLGARVLEPLRVMGALQRIIRHHHEFYDGSGYPDQLSGAQIPFGARVVAIADAFDTITSDRTYKKARSPEDALAELLRCAGAQFDPELVALFTKAMRRKLVTATVPPAEAASQPTADPAPR